MNIFFSCPQNDFKKMINYCLSELIITVFRKKIRITLIYEIKMKKANFL